MRMTKRKASSDRSSPKKRKRINCPEINTWLRMVETGKVPACEEQHLLAAYVRDVFATEKLAIDFERIERARGYQRYFPFELFAWEWFCFAMLFCVFREDGRPRWNQEFVYIGRGAGKNGFDAFCSFFALTKANGIREYDVDICANSEDQAKTSFEDVRSILENTSPKERERFKKSFKWNKEHVTCTTTNSKLRYRTDNPKSKDGLRSGMVIFDEVHQYRDWRNINVFTTGLGKKPHPRRLYTTTDGDVRDGVLDALLDKARKILRREIPDNGFLPFICRLDDPEEVHDEAMWPKANPSLPYRPDLLEEIRAEYQDFLLDPVSAADFLTKRFNCPQGNPALEVASWDDIVATNRELPDLSGLPCVVGIDFARTTDFVSAVLLFRVDGTYYAIHHSWLCANSKDRGRIKAPLEEWAAAGLLTVVDDVEVHPDLVTAWIYEQSCRYAVQKVAIDNYRHGFFMRELDGVGYSAKSGNVKLIRPSDLMLVHTKVNSVFVNHDFAWGDDPMLRWYANNTCLTAAPNNNYTFGKIEPKSRKTDGFMALVAAMCVEADIPDYGQAVYYEPVCL